LECHSTPEAAPKSLSATYGRGGGFGWQLNEIVGPQIISVPAHEVLNATRQSLLLVMGSVGAVFAIAILLINLIETNRVREMINDSFFLNFTGFFNTLFVIIEIIIIAITVGQSLPKSNTNVTQSQTRNKV
jgi:hypothetical protein